MKPYVAQYLTKQSHHWISLPPCLALISIDSACRSPDLDLTILYYAASLCLLPYLLYSGDRYQFLVPALRLFSAHSHFSVRLLH